MGAGSLGPVFRAHDPAENRLVALKVFRLDATPEQSVELATFLEQLVEQQPKHPAIAAALASGVAHGSAYLAQEYVTDEALDASMRQHGQPPLEAVLVTLSRLAEALDRAAGEGIHHGALHPRDVLVARGGEPRLIDLGVAQALHRAGLRAPIRRPYSAPERVAGGQWGGAADLFSLGAIAHELVTGRRISGPGAPAIAADSPSGLDQATFADVLARALALDPSARFASASDLVDELRPILARGRRLSGVRRVRPAVTQAASLPLGLDEFDRTLRVEDEVVALPSEAAPPAHEPDVPPTLAEVMQIDRFADVLQEEARSSFEHEPGGEPAGVPAADAIRHLTIPAMPSAAIDNPPLHVRHPPEPEPAPEAERGAHPGSTVEAPRDLEPTLLDRPPLRGATWSPVTNPAADRPLLPLLMALLVGLAGGFGIGYWVAWRSAVREAAHVLAASSVSATQAPAIPQQTTPPVRTVPAPPAPRAAAPAPAPVQPAARPRPAPPAPVERERPRPTREAPVTGTLVVRSTPAGAHVLVDGKLRGRTPLSVRDLPLRAATVTIEQTGYRPDERRIALSAAHPSVTLDARLTRDMVAHTVNATTGALVIESRPTGARVFLDDQEIGVTPLSLPDVAPGAHRIRLDMPGFARWTTTSQVAAGARTRVAASLEQGPSQ